MITHYYTDEEIKQIRKNLHEVIKFKNQFKLTNLNEEQIMSNFLLGNFKPGSSEDPLLDCFGTTVFQYKFTNIVPKRINIMTQSNLPHIMDAEVIPANKNITEIKGQFSTFSYGAKPSAKKQGKAIVFGTWNRGEESFDFKYVTKIEKAKDEVLKEKFSRIARLIDFLSKFNITVKETKEKNTFKISFAPVESEEAYGQFYEIESVEKEVNITDEDSLKEALEEIGNSVSEYATLLEDIANAKECREITFVKGKKNSVSYIATSSPELVGFMFKMVGNISSEQTWTASAGVENVIEHILTEEDLETMSSVIYDPEVGQSEDTDEEPEEDNDNSEDENPSEQDIASDIFNEVPETET